LKKEIQGLDEKLKELAKKIYIYENEIKNRFVRIDLEISNEEISLKKDLNNKLII
jgi:hypothetical protein